MRREFPNAASSKATPTLTLTLILTLILTVQEGRPVCRLGLPSCLASRVPQPLRRHEPRAPVLVIGLGLGLGLGLGFGFGL